MSWRNLTIGKKITLGFGLVLMLLALTVLLSFTGVGGIVTRASEVIGGNKLDGILAEKEVDHLNWVNAINTFLTSKKATKLTVQTDDHKCAFGQWLYGEGRKEAEALVPSLAPLLKRIEEPHRLLHQSAVGIGEHFKLADPMLPGFLAAREVDHFRWATTIDRLFIENLPELTIETDGHKCALGAWLYGEEAKKAAAMDQGLAELIEALKEPHRLLHQTAIDIQKKYKQIHPGLIELLNARLNEHFLWAQTVATTIIEGKSNLDVQTDSNQCGLGKFLSSKEAAQYAKEFPAFQRFLEAIREPHQKLHDSALDIKEALTQGQKSRAEQIFAIRTSPAMAKIDGLFREVIGAEKELIKSQKEAWEIYKTKTRPAMEETQKALHKVIAESERAMEGLNKANDIYSKETAPSLTATQKLLTDIRHEAKKHILSDNVMLAAALGTKRNVTIVGIAAFILGILFAFVIIRGIALLLGRVATHMGAEAEQVAQASSQVSSSSQSLAEGASENAAALEETSSSLEEILSMVRRNADSSALAKTLMDETRKVVDQVTGSMKETTASMLDISTSGKEIGKIIKTIDEISFQTNLLALNAAVEAARAGEAGLGFAVVAEEVRNLSQRAAEAAKSTAELIERTIRKIDHGNKLVKTAGEAFSELTTKSVKVAELVDEIAAASREQAQGIDQIGTAISQMDTVTQHNAANAEETASASEELSAQADEMRDSVNELLRMVGADKGETKKTLAISTHVGKRRELKATEHFTAEPARVGPKRRFVRADEVMDIEKNQGEVK